MLLLENINLFFSSATDLDGFESPAKTDIFKALSNPDEVRFLKEHGHEFDPLFFKLVCSVSRFFKKESVLEAFQNIEKTSVGRIRLDAAIAMIFQGDEDGYRIIEECLGHESSEQLVLMNWTLSEAYVAIHTPRSFAKLREMESDDSLPVWSKERISASLDNWDQQDPNSFY